VETVAFQEQLRVEGMVALPVFLAGQGGKEDGRLALLEAEGHPGTEVVHPENLEAPFRGVG
jgi:hypothetical protein